jgi:hypothetical protein
MRAGHDRQFFRMLCRFVPVRFIISKLRDMLDIAGANVDVAALSQGSAFQQATRFSVDRFRVIFLMRRSWFSFSAGFEAASPNALRMQAAHPTRRGICAVFQP